MLLMLGSGNKPSPLAVLLLLSARVAASFTIVRGAGTHIMLRECEAEGEDETGRFLRDLLCGNVWDRYRD